MNPTERKRNLYRHIKHVNKLLVSSLFLVIFGSAFLKISACYAQSNTGGEIPQNGPIKFYYPNGKVSSEGNMANGKPDGYWKTFYENEVLKSEGNRKNFQLDSTWKFYNEQGVLTSEYFYREGKKNGIKKLFNSESQKLVSEENFVNDVKQGYTVFYKEDYKYKEVPFVNGKEEGIGREFSKDSLILTITVYKNGYVTREEKINRKDKFGKKQGNWKSFYPNGTIHTECRYTDDLLDGYLKEYALDGNLIKTEKYDYGVLKKNVAELVKLDVQNDYYPSGKIKSSGTFKEGNAEGVTRYYSEEGKIINSKVYKDGELIGEGVYDEKGYQQGKWKEYYPSGELRAEGEYIDGRRNGDWVFYHQNGKIEQKGKFLKGAKPSGNWVWYYESGNLLREEKFTAGLEEGTMTEYNDSGRLITKGDYVEGEKEGLWMSEDGDVREEGNYKNGQKDGIWKTHYKSGKLAFEGKFVDGTPDGKHTYYHDNGRLKEEGSYAMGRKEDNWKYYDYEGVLETTISFKNDEELKIDGVKMGGGDEK